MDNPYAGAYRYIDPEWSTLAGSSAARASQDLRSAIAIVAQQPTAVWLDRIATIDGGTNLMGLAEHLDEAVHQQTVKGPNTPMVFEMVVYDLPDRDCAALASNGELKLSDNGMARYKSEYIDRIVQVLQSKPAYQNLRIVAVVEPDSLPNAVTNLDLPACGNAAAGYKEGVAYAIKKLSALNNVYIYLDMAHSGWLGWDHGDNAARVYREVMQAAGGESLVQGFAVNVANYSALQEPFNPYDNQNAYQDLIVNWYEWNRMIDEKTYVDAMRGRFPNHHFLIDTGRNGWKAQPAGVPIEARTHRGNWCNIKNAGIGERPKVAPMAGVDAYVWIKPPGASDGTSDSTQTTPDAEGKRFDAMCGQDPVVRQKGFAVATDALSGAPAAGKWFDEQFFMLVRNATPPLVGPGADTGSDNGGSTGTDTGGNTGTDTGGSTGTDTGGSTGTDTGGSTGTDTGGSTGTDTGGNTGTDTGSNTGSGTDTGAEVPPPVTTEGMFRVDSNGDITKNGAKMPIHCGAWFGLEGQHEPPNAQNNPGGAPLELYIGNMWWNPTGRTIQQTMTEIKMLGFNVVRLPIAPQTLDPTDPQGIGWVENGGALKNEPSVQQQNARQALEDFIKLADQNGIDVIIDIHSCSNYVGWRAGRLDAKPPYVDANRPGYIYTREEHSCSATGNPSSVTKVAAYDREKWLANLREIAGLQAQLGVDNIMAIDIFNEPWDYTWSEWKSLAESAYQAINEVNQDVLVMVEGIGSKLSDGTRIPYGNEAYNANWGENLYSASASPLNIPKERLVFSPHTYGPSVFVQKQFIDTSKPGCAGLEGDEAGNAGCNIVIDPAALKAGWDEHFGYLRDQGYAMIVGEFGGNWDWPNGASQAEQSLWSHVSPGVDAEWQNAFVDYAKARNINACYWSINPESADTGGLYGHVYVPGTNESGWGTWTQIDSRKMDLLKHLWN